jgi:hypothetical protein
VRQAPRHVGWRLAGLFALTILVWLVVAIVTLPEGEGPEEPTFLLVVIGVFAAISARAYVLVRRSGRRAGVAAIAGFAIGLGPLALVELTGFVARLVA